jgi:hypothetical protein
MDRTETITRTSLTRDLVPCLRPKSPLRGLQGKGGTIVLRTGRTVTVSSNTFRQIIGAGNMPYAELHTLLREVKRAGRTGDTGRRTQHLARAAQLLAEATERYLTCTDKD